MADTAAELLRPGDDPLAFYNKVKVYLAKDEALRKAFISDAILARVPSGERWITCGQMAVTGECRPKGDLDVVPLDFVKELFNSQVDDPDEVAGLVESEFRRVLSTRRDDHLMLTVPHNGIQRQERGLRVKVATTVDLGSENRPIGQLSVDVVVDPHTVRRTPRLTQHWFSGLKNIWPDSGVQLQDAQEVFAGKWCGAYLAASHPQIETQSGLLEAYLKYLQDCAEMLEQKLVDDQLGPKQPRKWLQSNLLEFDGFGDVLAARAVEHGIDPKALLKMPEVPGAAKIYQRRRRAALAEYLGGEKCSYHADLRAVRSAVDQAFAGPMDPRPALGRGPTRLSFGPLSNRPEATPLRGTRSVPRRPRP